MSFLFKSTKKGGSGSNTSAPNTASRDLRSSDGSNTSASQIPTPNGTRSTTTSPTPGASANNPTITSVVPPHDRSGANSRAAEERSSLSREESNTQTQIQQQQRSGAVQSPEQKTLRDPTAMAREQMRGANVAPSRADSQQGTNEPQQPSSLQQQQQRLQLQTRPSLQQNDSSSPYPWSQRRLTFAASSASPFPRYGAAVNAVGSKDGSIYLMGGLINGSTVKGDLWMVEAASTASMNCFPVATTSEGPGPRVGHASLLVGNAFIVFGGDTKMDEGDLLDDTLYLLNTSTKQWSRALPAGPRPPGRYGHTLNILGSKIYIFGGQVEGYFFNDLVAFDLNALQQASNRWEILIQNTIDGGPPHGQIPPARTNHTMVTWGDKLYLFGGTDGVNWFNDVWSYSPHTNSWTMLECIGYIPSPREGHAAALVGDVMYIFGGRTEEGNDLGDLAAFRISSRRWYTFQNMGPSPSPRSGHSMTAVGKNIVVLAGEPSSNPRDPVELGLAYFLDTSKIRYPADATPSTTATQPASLTNSRRPSTEANSRPTTAGMQVGRANQPPQTIAERSGSAAENRVRSPENGSRLPRTAQTQPPAGPPPQAPGQAARTNGLSITATRQPTRQPDRALSPTTTNPRSPRNFAENAMSSQMDGPRSRSGSSAPSTIAATVAAAGAAIYEHDDAAERAQSPVRQQKPETYQPSSESAGITPQEASLSRSGSRSQSAAANSTSEQFVDASETPLSKVRKMSEDMHSARPQDSGLGSSPAVTVQHEHLARELESVRQRNAWYASELALARKSGYQSRDSPILDESRSSLDGFGDEDRPLVEALLKMRAELQRVQGEIEEQSKSAAERIAEMEKQRDGAIQEAVFAKARLAGGSASSPRGVDGADGKTGGVRGDDISRRLAASLDANNELTRRSEMLERELDAERKARELAEDTADAAQKRVTELDSYRQQHAAELEGLRSDLHETQKEAREATASHAELASQHKLLNVDHEELNSKFDAAVLASGSHREVLASLKDAMQASEDKSRLLEEQLENERAERGQLETSLRELKTQHDQRASELESSTRQLRDAEELATRHAEEAKTHRQAVLAGLGQATERDSQASQANEQRIAILQEQVEAANGMARQNQAAADAASEKLRRAEERIAGLEAYQEQASREGLSIRKQLQATMKENNGLNTEKAALEQKMERHKLETNALAVQHASLKDILGERGVNASEVRRSRAIDSPSSARFSTPDPHRFRELEQNYETTIKNHDELQKQYEEVSERTDKMKRDYEEKLTALDNDHQAAVKYLRGTEKMLSKLKQELQRVKMENGDLKKKVDRAREDSDGARDADGAEAEKLRQELSSVQANLKTSVAELEGRITSIQTQLRTTEIELQQTKTHHATSQRELATLHTSHQQTRMDLEKLQRENSHLEVRAQDAEEKVQLLLDQVEHSVDNYRRQSRLSGTPHTQANGTGGHHRHVSDTGSHTSHSRGTSLGGDDSIYDDAHGDTPDLIGHQNGGGGADGRNSLALDSLASELETLRSHWETTKNYRLSDRFDFERTPNAASDGRGAAGSSSSWRHGLGLDDDDDEDDAPARLNTTKASAAHATEDTTPTASKPPATSVGGVSMI